MSKDEVDIKPATGIMFVTNNKMIYMIVAYEKDDNYVAISIPLKVVLENLIKNGYILDNVLKPKLKDGVV